MINSGFNTGIALLLFGQLLAQIISGLSGEVIPGNLILSGTGFFISLILLSKKSLLIFPKLNYHDLLFFLVLASFFVSAYMKGQGSSPIQKIIGVIYLIILPCLVIFLLSLSVRSMDIHKLGIFIRRLGIISIIIAVIMFMSGAVHHSGNSERISITGISNTIWFGRYLGIFIVVLVLTYKSKLIKMNSYITISLIIIAVYLMIGAGARGPFIAVIVAIVYAKFKVKPIILILSILFIVLLPFIFELSKAGDFLHEKGDFSGYNRIQLIKTAIELIQTNPFTGIGFGNFGIFSGQYNDSIKHYPHNILAEVFVECGIFTFLFFLLLIKQSFDLGKNNILFTSIFIYTFINSLLSGDITGNALLFISMFAIRIVSDKQLLNTNTYSLIRT